MDKKQESGGVTNKVCRNHPDRAATARCETCLTPICDECFYERDGVIFCSRNCAANYEVVNRNLDRFESKKQADRRVHRKRRLRKFARVSAYAAVLLFVWWFYVNYTAEVHYWLNRLFNSVL